MVYVCLVGCCMLFILGFRIIDNKYDKQILSAEIAKRLYNNLLFASKI